MHEDRSQPADLSSAVSAMRVPHLTLTLARQWGRMQLLSPLLQPLRYSSTLKGCHLEMFTFLCIFMGITLYIPCKIFTCEGKIQLAQRWWWIEVLRSRGQDSALSGVAVWGPTWALVLGSCFVPVVQMKAVGFSDTNKVSSVTTRPAPNSALGGFAPWWQQIQKLSLCPVFIAEGLLVRIRSRNSSSVHGFAFWWKIMTGLQKCPG